MEVQLTTTLCLPIPPYPGPNDAVKIHQATPGQKPLPKYQPRDSRPCSEQDRGKKGRTVSADSLHSEDAGIIG